MQRFLIVNIDRREYLDPEKFGDGPGLFEFASNGSGVMLGLAVLLSSGCTGGAQEPRSTSPLVGAWAENRIAISGDQTHAIFTDIKKTELRSLPIGPSLHEVASRLYTDISDAVVRVLAEEPYERRALGTKGALLRRQQMETERTKSWPSKRQPDGFCGGVFPHVYAPPDALRDAGLCIYCGTSEAVGVAAGDRGRRSDWATPRRQGVLR